MTYTKREVQDMLLAVLVRDLGYDHEPMYGHNPLRHQFAWGMATDGMTPADVTSLVAYHQERIAHERKP